MLGGLGKSQIAESHPSFLIQEVGGGTRGPAFLIRFGWGCCCWPEEPLSDPTEIRFVKEFEKCHAQRKVVGPCTFSLVWEFYFISVCAFWGNNPVAAWEVERPQWHNPGQSYLWCSGWLTSPLYISFEFLMCDEKFSAFSPASGGGVRKGKKRFLRGCLVWFSVWSRGDLLTLTLGKYLLPGESLHLLV